MRSLSSCSVSEAATSKYRSILDTINSTIHSFTSRHLASQSSKHRTITIAPSPQMPDPPLESSGAVKQECQTESDFGWLNLELGLTYDDPSDDDVAFKRDVWRCFALERQLRRQADHDKRVSLLRDLKRKMEWDKAELRSWRKHLKAEKKRFEEEYGMPEANPEAPKANEYASWSKCLDTAHEGYTREKIERREQHNSALSHLLSGIGVLDYTVKDKDGWLLIPAESDLWEWCPI